MQFLLMLVSVGRTALDVRVTRIDEMGKERRSLRVRLFLLDHGLIATDQRATLCTVIRTWLCHGHFDIAFRTGAHVYVALLVTFQTFSPLS